MRFYTIILTYKDASCIWILLAPFELVPMIGKDCLFLIVIPYCHFFIVILSTCLRFSIFHHIISYLFLSFHHGLLIWSIFLVSCLLFVFFFSFLLLSQNPSLSLDVSSSFIDHSSSPLHSSPFLGRIIHEFFLTVPRPNITHFVLTFLAVLVGCVVRVYISNS